MSNADFVARGDSEDIHGSNEAVGPVSCAICKTLEPKYKCPRCGAQTCSLACCKSHKQESGCSGKRKRCERLNELGEKQLLTDLSFLEDVQRECESAGRRRLPLPRALPDRLRELHHQAAKRGVWLEFMHPGMQKRTLSDLYFDRRSQKLLWHLEWHFVAAGLKIHDRRIPEHTSLRDALHKHVQEQKRGFKDDEKMQPYTEQEVSSLAVLMRRPYGKVGRVRYDRLEIGESLASQLRGKTVIEFPTLAVLVPSEVSAYCCSTDDEARGAEESSSATESSESSEAGSEETGSDEEEDDTMQA